MELILDNAPTYWSGFRVTLMLTLYSGGASLVLGLVLAALRVAPFKTLRGLAFTYVELIRNTPLTLVFFGVVIVLPQFGVIPQIGFLTAVVCLTLYTSAFVAEAMRSGINSVGVGQAEAARSIGLTFGQSLRLIVLPQAFRTVIPPLINVIIALAKNTSVAAGFGVVELVASGRRMSQIYAGEGVTLFAGVALFYLLITIPLGILANRLEKRLEFAR